MAPRANWKGYLKLSLVSCGVALFPATTTRDRVRFNIINRETGNRVRYDVVDADTGAEVPQEDRVKGYKVDRDSYVLLEEQELDEVALESTHTIEIEAFVERDEVDELYLDESYYLVPVDKVGYEAFAVIREAMRDEGLVGIARVVLYRRERLLMLSPRGNGIVGTTLRYNNEVREEQEPFWGWTPDAGFVELRARGVVSSRSMVAFWMVGLEDLPSRSAEICVAEVFGNAVVPSESAAVGLDRHELLIEHLVSLLKIFRVIYTRCLAAQQRSLEVEVVRVLDPRVRAAIAFRREDQRRAFDENDRTTAPLSSRISSLISSPSFGASFNR